MQDIHALVDASHIRYYKLNFDGSLNLIHSSCLHWRLIDLLAQPDYWEIVGLFLAFQDNWIGPMG